MQDIRLAIFDWDGTLMDSVGRIVACVQGAARDCELAVPAPTQIRQIIGLSLDVAMSRLFPLSSGSGSAVPLMSARLPHSSIAIVITICTMRPPARCFPGQGSCCMIGGHEGCNWPSRPANHAAGWIGYWMRPDCARCL